MPNIYFRYVCEIHYLGTYIISVLAIVISNVDGGLKFFPFCQAKFGKSKKTILKQKQIAHTKYTNNVMFQSHFKILSVSCPPMARVTCGLEIALRAH